MKKDTKEIAWWVNYCLFLSLEIRLIYEMTYLTWMNGEQMVGFSLVHNHYLYFMIAVIAEIIALILLLFYIYKIISNYMKKDLTPKLIIIKTIILSLTFCVGMIPYKWWTYMTELFFGPGK